MDYQAELCNLCSVPWQLIFNLHCPVCFLLKQAKQIRDCAGGAVPRLLTREEGWGQVGLGWIKGSRGALQLCQPLSPERRHTVPRTEPQAHICSFFPTEIPVTIATNFCMVTFSQGCLEKQFIFIHYHHTKLYKYSDKRKMHSANICILLLNHNLI